MVAQNSATPCSTLRRNPRFARLWLARECRASGADFVRGEDPALTRWAKVCRASGAPGQRVRGHGGGVCGLGSLSTAKNGCATKGLGGQTAESCCYLVANSDWSTDGPFLRAHNSLYSMALSENKEKVISRSHGRLSYVCGGLWRRRRGCLRMRWTLRLPTADSG